jgi:hypothetical protein
LPCKKSKKAVTADLEVRTIGRGTDFLPTLKSVQSEGVPILEVRTIGRGTDSGHSRASERWKKAVTDELEVRTIGRGTDSDELEVRTIGRGTDLIGRGTNLTDLNKRNRN